MEPEEVTTRKMVPVWCRRWSIRIKGWELHLYRRRWMPRAGTQPPDEAERGGYDIRALTCPHRYTEADTGICLTCGMQTDSPPSGSSAPQCTCGGVTNSTAAILRRGSYHDWNCALKAERAGG